MFYNILVWRVTGPQALFAYLPDNTNTDGSLHIWDLKRRREALSHPQRHPDGVKALDISHDGNTLCSAGADHAVRLLQTGATCDAAP